MDSASANDGLPSNHALNHTMLKVVHFGKYYFPDAGGIESVTASLARGTAQAGHKVTVVCFKKSTKSTTEMIEGVRVIRAPISKLIASQPFGWKYFRLCLKESQHADVVHVHAPNMLAALCSLLVGGKAKLVVHWHSDVIGKCLLMRLLKPLERALLKRADTIIATSQVYAATSPALKAFQPKISVVPIGVPHPKQRTNHTEFIPPDLASKLNGKKIILAVARLVPYKGLNVLIEAARHLHDDAVVVIVGDGPLKENLMRAVSVAASSKVHLVGRLNEEVLHALFNRSTLYCLPSVARSEAFGVVLLEAMAYGIPIVATNIPGSGVPWVNQHGVSGINVSVGDPVGLANACNLILSSPDEHARLSSGARQRFLSEFTEELSVSRTLAIYESMAGGAQQ